MSELRVNAIRHTGASSDAVTLATDGTCTAKITNNLSNRRLNDNGDMSISQRGSSFTDISNENGKYTLDRFEFKSTGTAAWTVAQSTAGSVFANTGFAQAVKVDCTTADASLSSNQEIFITQKIEAQNLQHLRYGQSAAKSLTLSFWTRSNKTGDYGIWFYAADGPRQYATTYTISSADTWEKKVITIPGDTSGTINNDNGSGFEVRFYLAAGPTHSGTPSSTWTSTINNRTTTLNLADSTSNEWYLTGLQLEVGDVATDFEHRSYGDELARCQRYFCKTYNQGVDPGTSTDAGSVWGRNYSATGRTTNVHNFPFPVQMRTTSSNITAYSVTGTSGQCSTGAGNPQDSNTNVNFTACKVASQKGWAGITTASIASGEWVGGHFTVDAEL